MPLQGAEPSRLASLIKETLKKSHARLQTAAEASCFGLQNSLLLWAMLAKINA